MRLSGSHRTIIFKVIETRLSPEDRAEIMRLIAQGERVRVTWAEQCLTRMFRALARAQECLNVAHSAMRKLKQDE